MSAVTIEEVVGRVPLFSGREVRVSELSGGLTNTNHLVEADGERYVVRIPGRSTELLAVDRRNERHNAEAAASTGVSPSVLAYLDELNVMVLAYVEGTTMSAEALRSADQARRMALSIRRLHAAPRFLRDFDMFELVAFYLRVCDERAIRVPEGFGERGAEVDAIRTALSARPLPTVPCHNDLLAENYIDDGRQLWIVDFEYSGNNDPCFELGDTAQECGFDEDLRAVLCEAYFGGSPPSLRSRMDLQAVMADVGWTLWAAIQAEISAIEYDFWGWALERWARAIAAFDAADFGRRLQDVRSG